MTALTIVVGLSFLGLIVQIVAMAMVLKNGQNIFDVLRDLKIIHYTALAACLLPYVVAGYILIKLPEMGEGALYLLFFYSWFNGWMAVASSSDAMRH